MTEKTPELSMAEQTLLRTGTCEAVVCNDPCAFFVYNRTIDSFRTCECGHSQQAHAKG